MATRAGSEVLEVVWAEGDGINGAPSSTKGRFVRVAGVYDPLPGPVTSYKMRARDTGAGFVYWIAADPNADYPGTPVGSIVEKQIAAILPVSG